MQSSTSDIFINELLDGKLVVAEPKQLTSLDQMVQLVEGSLIRVGLPSWTTVEIFVLLHIVLHSIICTLLILFSDNLITKMVVKFEKKKINILWSFRVFGKTILTPCMFH